MKVYQDEKLKNHVAETLDGDFKERFLLEDLHKYMTSENDRKVCCLYGLRCTGKTIMMLQEIKKLDDYNNCLLVRCEDGDNMWQLRKTIEKTLEDNPQCGKIFINEATKAENFINTCSFLADDYAARGIKVVMSGTDSLGFFLAKNNELFDRVHLLRTTYISFKEYNYVLGKSIKEYITYGGTLTDGSNNVFYNGERANLYTNSAIVENISNTIKKWNNSTNYGQKAIRDIIDHDDFPSFVKKVLEMDNRKFLASISDTVRMLLGIKENLYETATEEAVNAIILYLKCMDVLYEIPKTAYLSSGRDMFGEDADKEYLFTQPGMRCCQVTELANSLFSSEIFRHYSFSEKELLLHRLNGNIHEQILKDTIFFQLSHDTNILDKNKSKREVLKYRDAKTREEFIVVLDYGKQTFFAIEVTLSDRSEEGQGVYLRNEKLLEELMKETGMPLVNRAVVYMGISDETKDGILYFNAEEFLIHSQEMVDALV